MFTTFIHYLFIAWFVGLFFEAIKGLNKIRERATYRNNFLRRARKHLDDKTCDPDEIVELEEDLRECETYNEMRLCYMVFDESHSYPYCK